MSDSSGSLPTPPSLSQAIQDENSLPLEISPQLRSELQKTRGAEFNGLKSIAESDKTSASFPWSLILPIFSYLRYLVSTGINIFRILVSVKIPLHDKLMSVAFATTTSFVLGLVLLWCQFAALPRVVLAYWLWSENFGGNLGLVNALKPDYFEIMTDEQISAARDALSAPPVPRPAAGSASAVREFNLDIAKLLLQFASVVYERKSEAIYETINDSPGTLGTSSFVPVVDLPSASLKESLPGDDFRKPKKEDLKNDRYGTNAINSFCRRTGLGYMPVSELQTSKSAYCSFFLDVKRNWIVVTFKGTGPTEYADWVTDLTTSLVDVDDFLPKFSKAVKGFKNRLYPTDLDPRIQGIGLEKNQDKPWDTISKTLKLIAADMEKGLRPDEKINVWFTGHSLGCALASLAYTRSIHSDDFKKSPRIRIRDAYIFAAPILGDRATSDRFNTVINQGDYLKTLWRITNANDLVATGLPQLGDNPYSKLSPTHPAGFAHIGAEIKLKDYPTPSQFTGPLSLLSPDTIVRIHSRFTPEEVQAQRKELHKKQLTLEFRERLGVLAQKIPLIGRLIAHTPALYWNQLSRVVPGECEWVNGY